MCSISKAPSAKRFGGFEWKRICRRSCSAVLPLILLILAGIARTHLSMIETGRKQANFETIWRLALALELRPSELVAKIEQTCQNQ